MKLVMAIVQDEDAYHIMDLLVEKNFRVTKLASSGGFLRAGVTTLISGVEDARVPELIEIIEKKCKSRTQIASVAPSQGAASESYIPFPAEVTVGGATIFVLDVAEFKQV